MAKRVLHYRSVRLFVNAGMQFPACKAGAKLLDLDATCLPSTGDKTAVTCKRCKVLASR